ncbi:hypothetical protein N9R79_11935 [Vibrio sp.]|nr:hypothetical protein [Vibrio sp.]
MLIITDIKEGEKDILEHVKFEELVFKNLEGKIMVKMEAPKSGWNHEKLCIIAEDLPNCWKVEGLEAFLCGEIIGSTEF